MTGIIKRFWSFLKEDSWQSWLISLLLVILAIRFLFFPLLSIITGASLPLVIVESCSMYHGLSFEKWWELNAGIYSKFNIAKSDFLSFPLKNGFTKGDIIIVWGRSSYEKGDILIFKPNKEARYKTPIIHRIVSSEKENKATKGDNNEVQLKLNDQNNPSNIDETSISSERILGKAVGKIPYLGWVKLIFFEPFRPEGQRGFCS